jgi:hypothetical protein
MLIIINLILAAAICVHVSCQRQELTTTLREGNYSCRGEEVIFTCSVVDSSLSVLVLAWSSNEYIGSGDLLQFTTNQMPGANDTSAIDGNVIATLTRNTNETGVLMVESTLRIIAVRPSVVTCDVTNRLPVSQSFSVSGINNYTHSTYMYGVFSGLNSLSHTMCLIHNQHEA